jgi:hypothetical protein
MQTSGMQTLPPGALQMLANSCMAPFGQHHQRPRQRFSEWRVGPLFNILYFGRWATLLYIVFSVIYCGILCHHAVWYLTFVMTLLINIKFKKYCLPNLHLCYKDIIVLTNLGVHLFCILSFLSWNIYCHGCLDGKSLLKWLSQCLQRYLSTVCVNFSTSFYKEWQIKAGLDLVLVT